MLGKITNAIFKRTSTMVLFAVGGAFVFERVLDVGADALFNRINQGKLWNQIKHKYE